MSSGGLLPGEPLKVAILAMGGQGGGVLADWLVAMAEQAGWWAQSTSVPGVAQRTGATIYYLELMPAEAVDRAGRAPVLAMMPTPGDVDLVVAAELMEAGRAIQRGLVTPDRTTLLASTHRSLAVVEKSAPGNGIADPNRVVDAGRELARRMICADFDSMARAADSVISASLFGAIAGAGALPFGRAAFEATIASSGRGVDASLAAFGLGFDAARSAPAEPEPIRAHRAVARLEAFDAKPALASLLSRIRRDFPAPAWPMLAAGADRLVDFQDAAYAGEYLDRIAAIGGGGPAVQDAGLLEAAARRLAVAMSYDDVIRVADLKTRATRFERIRAESRTSPDRVLRTTEFMHPRLDEIAGLLPVGLGRWLLRSPVASRFVERRLARPRRIRTDSIRGFAMLWALAGMRRWRRRTLRHAQETESIERWWAAVRTLAPADAALARELIDSRRLVKGYSATHERGIARFERLLALAPRLAGRPDAAATMRSLRELAATEAPDDEAAFERRLDELEARVAAPPRQTESTAV